MNHKFASETKDLNHKCPITGEDTEFVINSKIRKYYFSTYVRDKFLTLVPEYITNKKSRILQLYNSCYFNELMNGNVNIRDISRDYIESKYKFYNPQCYEYYLHKSNGDADMAKQLLYNRQSTTSVDKFKQKYGDNWEIEYKNHFTNVHSKNSGSNHWLRKNGISDFKKYVQDLHGFNDVEINEYLSNYKSISDPVSKYELRKSLAKKYLWSDDSRSSWDTSRREKISKMKTDGSFYREYGCWKVVYEYCKLNNIEYTDENRIYYFNKLYKFNYTDGTKKYSKTATSVLDHLEQVLNISLSREVWVGNFIADGLDETNKIIIEFFGDYWHANPKFFLEDSNIRDKIAYSIWNRDKIRLDVYKSYGYDVYIIWETDWKTKKDSIIQDIKQMYESRTRI